MFRVLRLTVALALIATLAGITNAGDGDVWSIVKVSGEVWVQSDGMQRVSLGDAPTIAAGATLTTSAGGRVLLRRGAETMVVGPGSVMSLPKASTRFFTTVLEATGEIEFDVERRNVRHFAVKTPRLAAVVKGTHFIVRAGADGDTVTVDRGIVEVEALNTGQKVDIRAGQGAEVSDAGLAVFRQSDHADIGSSATETASLGGGNGVGASVGGSNGVEASAGGGNGVGASVGGSNGLDAGVGGGNGVSASVGGSNGVDVGVGGGHGISVSVGGIGIGIGGH